MKTAFSVYSDHIQIARDTGNETFLDTLEQEIEGSSLLTPSEVSELLDDVYEAQAYISA